MTATNATIIIIMARSDQPQHPAIAICRHYYNSQKLLHRRLRRSEHRHRKMHQSDDVPFNLFQAISIIYSKHSKHSTKQSAYSSQVFCNIDPISNISD